ncbi:hypothetical protein KKC60_05195 [Patescibacteria group bacterium]|nr:hypothetical protein [Patescibacteria group bacterium]
MPYLLPKDRDRLDPLINQLAEAISEENRAGDINYIINQLLLGNIGQGKYKDYNELVGTLEAAKLEFYRRKVAPYEEKKAKENGDLEGFASN